jgi:hypothetical protein
MRTEFRTPDGLIAVQSLKELTPEDRAFVIAVADRLGIAKRLRWQRRAHEFMIAQGAMSSLVHVDWRHHAANEDAIDTVISEMIAIAD